LNKVAKFGEQEIEQELSRMIFSLLCDAGDVGQTGRVTEGLLWSNAICDLHIVDAGFKVVDAAKKEVAHSMP
jgi:hypothetical protein